MKTKSFIPPPGSRIVSLRSDGRSKSEKLVKKQLKKAMTKVRKSRVEKDEQLRQLDADWEAVIPRKTLAPKTKRKRALETAQCFEVPWPDVHAEMDLSELITARVSLAVTLTGLFEEQHIGFYKDADSACTALSAIITTLRSPAQSSEDHHNDSIRLSQIMFATTHMESAVELLTCKMLDPTSPQHYLYGGGPLLLRIDTGPHWKSIENKISVEVQAVKTLVVIGDMLVRGIKDGQWEFVRGVLESVGVFGSAKGNESDTRRIHLLTKTDFLRCIEKRKDTYTDFRMNESRAQAIQNYYTPLTSSEDLAAHRLLLAVGASLPATPLRTSKSNLASRNCNKKPHTFSAKDCTSSNSVTQSSVTPRGLKRLRERENKNYRETRDYEDSDSSADGDDIGEINKKSEPWKRLKLNPDMRLLAEPEPGPSSQETPAMRRVRMEIESVRICEENIMAVSERIDGGGNYGEAGREEQVL